MLEILYPLLAAATFAISSVMIRNLGEYQSPINLNFLRASVGAFCFIIHLLIIKKLPSLLSLDGFTVLILVLSVLFNVVLGDTSYFASQERIGVKIATPIVNIYPLATVILAFFFLDEEITIPYILGTIVIITGIILLSQTSDVDREGDTSRVTGFVLAFLAVLLYAFGVLTVTIASNNIDPVVANVVRMPTATILLLFMTRIPQKNKRVLKPWDRNSTYKMIITGILGTYFSSLFLVMSAQALGAGLTSVLTSLGPLFALPLAFFWLKEKITKSVILGTILTLVGLFIVLLL